MASERHDSNPFHFSRSSNALDLYTGVSTQADSNSRAGWLVLREKFGVNLVHSTPLCHIYQKHGAFNNSVH